MSQVCLAPLSSLSSCIREKFFNICLTSSTQKATEGSTKPSPCRSLTTDLHLPSGKRLLTMAVYSPLSVDGHSPGGRRLVIGAYVDCLLQHLLPLDRPLMEATQLSAVASP